MSKPKIEFKAFSRPDDILGSSDQWTEKKILEEFKKNKPYRITKDMVEKYGKGRTTLQYLRRILDFPEAIKEIEEGKSPYVVLDKIITTGSIKSSEKSIAATKETVKTLKLEKGVANIVISRVESVLIALAEDKLILEDVSKKLILQLRTDQD